MNVPPPTCVSTACASTKTAASSASVNTALLWHQTDATVPVSSYLLVQWTLFRCGQFTAWLDHRHPSTWADLQDQLHRDELTPKTLTCGIRRIPVAGKTLWRRTSSHYEGNCCSVWSPLASSSSSHVLCRAFTASPVLRGPNSAYTLPV